MKWLQLQHGAAKGGLSQNDRQEVIDICKKLEAKGKYQKAANLMYYCIAGDSSNEELRRHWDRLVAKTNEERREDILKRKEEAQRVKAMPAKTDSSDSLSMSQRWKEMGKKGLLPKDDDVNWHLKKLKPWRLGDAMSRGYKFKQNAANITDPFKKVFELEEAAKMFNRVLELKPHDTEARGALNECCSAMNNEYVRMKKVKRTTKVRALCVCVCV